MIKRYLSGFIALVAAFGIIACSSDGGSSGGGGDDSDSSDTTLSYIYSTAGTIDFTSAMDTWSSGTTLDSACVTDATYNPCIQLLSGTGWSAAGSSVVAFTGLNAGLLSCYNYLQFKVKTSDYSSIYVQVPKTEKSYSVSSGTSLSNGWVQMSIPLSDFSTYSTTATQLVIYGNGLSGTILLTDVSLYSFTSDGLSSLITTASALAKATTIGSDSGNVSQTDMDTFTAAISAAKSVLNSKAATHEEVIAAVVNLNAAITAFNASLVVLEPTDLPAAPTEDSANVISMLNTSGTYTDITVGNWNPNWSQSGSIADFAIGDKTIKYMNLIGYQGVNICTANGDASTTAGETIDITGKTSLHISYWSKEATSLSVYPINNSTEYEIAAGTLVTTGAWTDLEIVINKSGFDLTTLRQLKFVGNGKFYMDNIYFHPAAATPVVVITTPSGLAVTGTNGDVYVSGMTSNHLTVTYATADSYSSMKLYTTQGDGAGNVIADGAMTYDSSTHYWTYTYSGSDATYVDGKTVHLIILPNGANVTSTTLPQGDLGDYTTWSSFTYNSSY